MARRTEPIKAPRQTVSREQARHERLVAKLRQLGYFLTDYFPPTPEYTAQGFDGSTHVVREQAHIWLAAATGFDFAGKDAELWRLLTAAGYRIHMIEPGVFGSASDGRPHVDPGNWEDLLQPPHQGYQWGVCLRCELCGVQGPRPWESIQGKFFVDCETDAPTLWDAAPYPRSQILTDLDIFGLNPEYRDLKGKRAWTMAFKAMDADTTVLDWRNQEPVRFETHTGDLDFQAHPDCRIPERLLMGYFPGLRLLGVWLQAHVHTPKWRCRDAKGDWEVFESLTYERGIRAVWALPAQGQPVDFQSAESFEQYALQRCRADYGEDGTRILDLVFQHRTQAQIAHELLGDPNKQPTIAKRLTEIQLKSLGYWFEDWYCAGHHVPANPEKNQPIPDAIVDAVPHSLKCFLNTRRTVSLPKSELTPELNYAQEHKTQVHVVVYSAYYHQQQEQDFATADAVPATLTFRFGPA